MARIFAKLGDTELLYATAHLSDRAFRALVTLAMWGAHWRTGASIPLPIARKLLRGTPRTAAKTLAELTSSQLGPACVSVRETEVGPVLTIAEHVFKWGRVGGTSTDTVAALASKQGMVCAYCRAELTADTLAVDHVFPLSRGGSDREENLVLSCRPCNSKKNAGTPTEKGMVVH
jgi:hypothetical protein